MSKSPSSPTADASAGLEVSLTLEGVPSLVDGIAMCVLVRNLSTGHRFLVEHLNAQLKKYSSAAQDCFWKTQQEVQIEAGGGEDPLKNLKRGRGGRFHLHLNYRPGSFSSQSHLHLAPPPPQF